MGIISIDGYNCFYEQRESVAPKTETIVFIHGAGGNHKLWHNQFIGLKGDFSIIIPDLPGHGKSAGKAFNTINDYSSFINKLLDYAVSGPVYLVGHSMGGAIAMDFTLKYSQKVKGLILIGTGSRLKVAPQILDTFGSGQHFLKLVKWFYSKNPPKSLLDYAKENMISTDPRVWFADFTACNNFDLTDNLQNIKTPALVIGADEDMLTPLKFIQALEANLPYSHLVKINGAGHMMMLEKPDQVNQAITNFIKGE